jgi:hypothetical protein
MAAPRMPLTGIAQRVDNAAERATKVFEGKAMPRARDTAPRQNSRRSRKPDAEAPPKAEGES